MFEARVWNATLWLFNIFIDGVLREATVMLQMVKNSVIWLLVMLAFADDLARIVENPEDLRMMIECFSVFLKRRLRVNAANNKFMVCVWGGGVKDIKVE